MQRTAAIKTRTDNDRRGSTACVRKVSGTPTLPRLLISDRFPDELISPVTVTVPVALPVVVALIVILVPTRLPVTAMGEPVPAVVIVRFVTPVAPKVVIPALLAVVVKLRVVPLKVVPKLILELVPTVLAVKLFTVPKFIPVIVLKLNALLLAALRKSSVSNVRELPSVK